MPRFAFDVSEANFDQLEGLRAAGATIVLDIDSNHGGLFVEHNGDFILWSFIGDIDLRKHGQDAYYEDYEDAINAFLDDESVPVSGPVEIDVSGNPSKFV